MTKIDYKKQIFHVGCWADARRKFMATVQSQQPRPESNKHFKLIYTINQEFYYVS